MKTHHKTRDAFDIWNCIGCGAYGDIEDRKGKALHDTLPPFRAYNPLVPTTEGCTDPWCDHPHEDYEQFWNEAEGAWL